jgi:hypothetical protein
MQELVVDVLSDPAYVLKLRSGDWELLLRQARHAALMGRVASIVARSNAMDDAPETAQRHLKGALVLAEAHRREAMREVAYLREALCGNGCPIVLLKGAAYAAASLPPAEGRTFSDTDILVPRSALAAVESRLAQKGWASTHLDPYDQRYYREWMHELPPMEHIRRRTVVDVHHNIAPPVSRLKIDAGLLIDNACAVPSMPGVSVLAPEDMVLHAMVHLFQNEDTSRALRDLSDIDLLLRHFASKGSFWSALIQRAQELHLSRVLHYGLRFAHEVFSTPIDAKTLELAGRAAAPWPLDGWMHRLWRHALSSQHPDVMTPQAHTALVLLFLRGHWLRMPPPMLARHLLHKGLVHWRDRNKAA